METLDLFMLCLVSAGSGVRSQWKFLKAIPFGSFPALITCRYLKNRIKPYAAISLY